MKAGSRMFQHEPPPEHDRGLAYDLSTLSRRRALRLFAGVGLATIVGCARGERAIHDGVGHNGVELAATFLGGVGRYRSGGELRGDSGGDRRSISRRWVERAQRAHRVRHRPQRHPIELRYVERNRRRDSADRDLVTARPGQRMRCSRRRRGLPVAMRSRRSLLALFRRHHRPELPARSAGGRQQRRGHLLHDLPGGLLGALAAYPLRGVPEPGRGDQRRQRHGDLAARARQKTSATSSTPPTATSKACATWLGRHSMATTCLVTTAPNSSWRR